MLVLALADSGRAIQRLTRPSFKPVWWSAYTGARTPSG